MVSRGSMQTEHAYTRHLRAEIARYHLEVRGPNGIASQSRISPARLGEIIGGDRPTEEENRGICRAIPSMKHRQGLILEWLKVPDPPAPPPSIKPPPAPPPTAPIQPTPAPVAAPRLMLAPRTFGEFLRAAREAEGMTHEELGGLLGVTRNAVAEWEKDEHSPIQAHHDHLLALLPVLAAPEVPRPPCRDISKPPGRGGMAPPEPSRASAASEPAASAPASLEVSAGRSPLIALGVSLGRMLAQLATPKLRRAVVLFLRDAHAAGLSSGDVADQIEREVGA